MNKFTELLNERILFLDGAMGTMIQRHKLEEADYRGERFADWPSDLKGNNDLLCLTQPQVVADIWRSLPFKVVRWLPGLGANGPAYPGAPRAMESDTIGAVGDALLDKNFNSVSNGAIFGTCMISLISPILATSLSPPI